MVVLDWNPTNRTLRQFAGVAFAFLAGVAGIGYLRGSGTLAVAVPLGLGGGAALVAWLRPQALRLVFVLLSLAVYPIGFVVSHFILLLLFYGVITPLGVLGRLVAPDPLSLGRDEAAASYWRERHWRRDKASYLRQA